MSVLYPFVVAAELDERVTTALHELFIEQPLGYEGQWTLRGRFNFGGSLPAK